MVVDGAEVRIFGRAPTRSLQAGQSSYSSSRNAHPTGAAAAPTTVDGGRCCRPDGHVSALTITVWLWAAVALTPDHEHARGDFVRLRADRCLEANWPPVPWPRRRPVAHGKSRRPGRFRRSWLACTQRWGMPRRSRATG